MKYFLDTEFLEGTQNQYLFGIKTPIVGPNTIDLISIGIVAEDGREYYAISKDFHLKEAWNRFDEKVEIMSGDMRNRFPHGIKRKEYWIRENVLKSIFYELRKKEEIEAIRPSISVVTKYPDYDFSYKQIKRLLLKYGKTSNEICKNVKSFCGNDEFYSAIRNDRYSITPEFYAYFADYDWVVFCWLFGKMNNLPKGFPQYCKDLKQSFDEKQAFISDVTRYNPKYIGSLKKHVSCPIQDPSKSHNAIEDARWNKEFFNFLDKTCPLL
jgi:hypothetical protein